MRSTRFATVALLRFAYTLGKGLQWAIDLCNDASDYGSAVMASCQAFGRTDVFDCPWHLQWRPGNVKRRDWSLKRYNGRACSANEILFCWKMWYELERSCSSSLIAWYVQLQMHSTAKTLYSSTSSPVSWSRYLCVTRSFLDVYLYACLVWYSTFRSDDETSLLKDFWMIWHIVPGHKALQTCWNTTEIAYYWK